MTGWIRCCILCGLWEARDGGGRGAWAVESCGGWLSLGCVLVLYKGSVEEECLRGHRVDFGGVY